MIICFTSIIVVVLLFTGTSLYKKFNDMATHYATQSAKQLMSQVKYSLDTYTRSMIDVSNTLYYKIIKHQSVQENTFTSQMSLIQTTNNHIANLAIFKENGELIAANRYMQVREGVDVSQQEWFQKAIEKPENVHFSSPHQQKIFQDNTPYVITLSRVVSLNEGGNIIQGVLVVDMYLTGIENIGTPIQDSDIGNIYIVATDGRLVYGDPVSFENMQNAVGQTLDAESTLFQKEKLLVTTQVAGYTGWKVIGAWDLKKLLVDYDTFQNFLIRVLVLGVVLCVLGTLFISSRLSAPLYKLQKSMKLVEEGNFNIRLPEEGEYIVSELSKTFNKMVERIKGLKHEIVTEQDDKRKKEMEVLQSQINPHFLYNTLDSIIWLVEDERNEEATMMITALSRFFRIGISGGKTIITVRQELEHARNYLAIQKIRYKNKFEYTLEAEKGTLECQTLKLVLQPLIENALYHGIQYIQHQGQIHIQVWQEEGLLMYRVQDNGVGMERNRCASLLEEDTIISSKGSGIGIRNVHRRIQLYYGIDYGLEIESEQDEGTTVLIKMPLTDQAY